MVTDFGGVRQSPGWAAAGTDDVFVMETFDLFQYAMEEASMPDPGTRRNTCS